MKKILLLAILALVLVTAVSAAETAKTQDRDVRRFQLQNTFPRIRNGFEEPGG